MIVFRDFLNLQFRISAAMKKLLFLFSFFAITLLSLAQEDWVIAKDRNGIKVYTRTPQGSKIKAFKAETMINASIPELLAALNNIAARKEWMYAIKKAVQVGETHSTAERYVYAELSIPWPFSNRDLVIHEKIIHKDKAVDVIMKLHTGLVAKKKGLVRMPVAQGGWFFSEVGNGYTRVRYEFFGDPGGKIPVWIINLFIVDGPYTTLLNLKDRVEK